MAPRASYGDRPMTPAERVRRARWVNRFEETTFKLLDLLNEAPNPLPRIPEIPSDLIDRLKPFIELTSSGNTKQTRKTDVNQSPVRVLKLGNGNQLGNKKRAIQFVAAHLNAEIIDNRTVHIAEWGSCHVSAYTHAKGAMISAPNKEDQSFGGADWHNNDHIILFRDVGDGRCKIYINEIEPLFNYRTIGHHGVLWENIEQLASHTEVINSQDVLKELMDKTEILNRLEYLGFKDTKKNGLAGHHRVMHRKIDKGSLYVGDQYISGTGEYAEIKKHITPSSSDHHGYPEWKNNSIEAFLNFLETWVK